MRRPNTNIHIYHNGSTPPTEPDASVRVFLQDLWRDSEAAEQTATHPWTAILECPLTTDFRDDYPNTPTNTTIYTLADDGEVEQAYQVVFVERRPNNRGWKRPDFLRVYLQRLAQFTAPTNLTTDCAQCPTGAAQQWSFTLAGVTEAGTCGNCTINNDTFTLTHSTGCLWLSPEYAGCGGGFTAPWELTYTPDTWRLLNTGFEVLYTLAGSSFQCRNPNTFAFDSASFCTDWPATLTLEPV